MTIKRVVPNITSNRIEESVAFYTEFLGFRVAMNLGWIVTVVSPTSPTAQISFVSGEPAHEFAAITLSVEVDDVDALQLLLCLAVTALYTHLLMNRGVCDAFTSRTRTV